MPEWRQAGAGEVGWTAVAMNSQTSDRGRRWPRRLEEIVRSSFSNNQRGGGETAAMKLLETRRNDHQKVNNRKAW